MLTFLNRSTAQQKSVDKYCVDNLLKLQERKKGEGEGSYWNQEGASSKMNSDFSLVGIISNRGEDKPGEGSGFFQRVNRWHHGSLRLAWFCFLPCVGYR